MHADYIKPAVVALIIANNGTNTVCMRRAEPRKLDMPTTTQPTLSAKKAPYADKKFGGFNMPNEAFSLLGRNFIRTVLAPYHSERITLRDASEYLNRKTKHIPKVAQIVLSEVSH